ncbi:MAG: DUF134 domain-containing protein [Ignavibacteriales bacterium]|nr:DUF134 domain-containing protein [Ignavibacteriales bacterium]
MLIINIMPRNKKHRTVKCNPTAYYYKPQSIPLSELEEVILEIDELESLRLADYLAHSHEQAAAKMTISRSTFGRIVESARNKVVDAILNGKAIKIGNEFPEKLKEKRAVKCKNCGSPRKNVPSDKNETCHKCKKINKEK